MVLDRSRLFQLSALTQRQPDGGVESDDRQHRENEERERVHEEDGLHHRHSIHRDVADKGVGERGAVAGVGEVVEGAGVHRKRDRGGACDHPDDDDDAAGAFQTVCGLGAQRVAYGEVALDGECRNSEHAGSGRHLGEERLEEAVRLAEAPRIRLPDGVHLRWQACHPSDINGPS